MSSDGSTEWKKTTTRVGERLVVLARRTKTQTVNVCTADNVPGRYEFRYRLPIGADIEPGDLAELDGLDALRQFLEMRNGALETPDGSQPAQVPAPISVPPADDPWVVAAAAATERALDTLVDEFREKPYLHRVEHSLHVRLHALLVEERILAEEVQLKSGERTQLVHKEWPETVPGGPEARRGSFDLVVLAPQQLREAELAQFRQGRIEAPIVIEVGLDYGLRHLEQDMSKLLNSGVAHPYVLHLSRVPITPDKQEPVEYAIRRASSPIKSAYVHIDPGTGGARYKRVGQAEIAPA